MTLAPTSSDLIVVNMSGDNSLRIAIDFNNQEF